jgi:hypothetical protein
MDEARAAADVALGRKDSAPLAGEGEGLVIRRGIGGRLRVMAAGRRWWSGRHDGIFLGHLRASGNVAASARAAGFTPKSAWNRRERSPAFARAMDEALEDAEIGLEYRVIAEASERLGLRPEVAEGEREAERGLDGAAGPGEGGGRLDLEQAMRILTWRENKRQGRHRRRRLPPEPTIEAVTEKILRGVRAIKRHRERYGPQGDAAPG